MMLTLGLEQLTSAASSGQPSRPSRCVASTYCLASRSCVRADSTVFFFFFLLGSVGLADLAWTDAVRSVRVEPRGRLSDRESHRGPLEVDLPRDVEPLAAADPELAGVDDVDASS